MYKIKRFSSSIDLSQLNIIARDGKRIELREYKSGMSSLLSKFSKRVRDNLDKSPNYDIYVDNVKIGEVNPSVISRDELNLIWIEIDEKFRGKGYAQSVLSAIVDLAKKMRFKYVTLEVPGNSPDAKHIYEKMGFKDDGYIGDDPVWGGLTRMKLILR